MSTPLWLITIGGLFLIGLLADELGRRTKLPRVTLLILLGVMLGPTGFDLLPSITEDWYDLIASIALTMVAFLLGGALSMDRLQAHGREILIVSVVVVLVTILVVFGGFLLLGAAPVLALLFAGVSTATDPAATQEVIKNTQSKGPFVEALKGIVAIDDAWALIIFSAILAFSSFLIGNDLNEALSDGFWDIFGAIGVGLAVGVPSAFLTGRLHPGEPMQTEALAVVFLCAGVASLIGVSYLLSGIVAGAVVVNFASHHARAFHEIENVEWPFMLVFFLLAGSRLHAVGWMDYGLYAFAFVILRTVSRIVGGWLGGRIAGSSANMRNWIGSALLPQAGVAVGMALVAGSYFPDLAEPILNTAIISTIIFEVFGPIMTRIALTKNAHAFQSGPS